MDGDGFAIRPALPANPAVRAIPIRGLRINFGHVPGHRNADDTEAVVKALTRKAKSGDLPAARELFDRILGKPQQSVDLASGTMMVSERIVLVDDWYGTTPKSPDQVDGRTIFPGTGA